VGAAISTVESEAGMRGVELLCGDIPSGLRVLGYRGRLDQVLINLLHNAVKFNRPGGSVRVNVEASSDDRVRIAITDTGIGIPSEDLPRVFERFYRVDKARSREVGGTGLGLSIVKHAMEQMNGEITVESTLGKGSCFTVGLPLAPNSASS
jgi:two-component system phosphate regulon sensor histidine kinase PhoR